MCTTTTTLHLPSPKATEAPQSQSPQPRATTSEGPPEDEPALHTQTIELEDAQQEAASGPQGVGSPGAARASHAVQAWEFLVPWLRFMSLIVGIGLFVMLGVLWSIVPIVTCDTFFWMEPEIHGQVLVPGATLLVRPWREVWVARLLWLEHIAS